MIGHLRGKFVGAAMLAMFIVLAVIVSVINLWNYASICREADGILQVLSDNGGYFPKGGPKDKKAEEAVTEEGVLEDRRQGEMRLGENGKWSGSGMSPEMPYESRYFTAVFQGDVLISVNTGNVAAVDSGTAAGYGQQVLVSDRERGFLGSYRYMKSSIAEEDSVMILFLDCRKSFATFRDFCVASAAVSLLGLASVFLLVLLFSRAVFRPVEESVKKQKQFITDAGHELKTPLAIISANAEVLEMEQGDSEWLKSIRNQVERLSELTADLIQLTRMEEGGLQLDISEFSLSELVQQAAYSFEPLAKAGNIRMESDIRQNILIKGDKSSIQKLLSVLMDNGVKYCRENGEITVTLGKSGKNTVLSVSNTAREPLPGNPEQMFERFYRGDSARNSGTGGYGMGLAIAKAIVRGHQGKIEVSVKDGNRICFHVIL